MDRIADNCLREKMNLTFSQFRILIVIYKHQNITQAKIAKFHDLTRAAVKRQVELLKEIKLLETSKSPGNKKQQLLTLTSEGQKKVQKALLEFNKMFSPMYKTLNKEELVNLETSLLKLSGVIHSKF